MLTLEQQILLKANPNSTFVADNTSILPNKTDHDHFPYTRYYRGEYKSPNAIISDNNAGWQRVNNNCYSYKLLEPKKENDTCFQLPCNNVLPCRDKKGKSNCGKSKKSCGCPQSPDESCINISP